MSARQCNCGRAIAEIPIWQLTAEQIAAMPEQQQEWVRRYKGDLYKTGAIAVILANPGRDFEVVIDLDKNSPTRDGWKLRPVPWRGRPMLEGDL